MRKSLGKDISYSEAGITVRETRDLWDMPIVFLLLLMLRAGEWLLRRKVGCDLKRLLCCCVADRGRVLTRRHVSTSPSPASAANRNTNSASRGWAKDLDKLLHEVEPDAQSQHALRRPTPPSANIEAKLRRSGESRPSPTIPRAADDRPRQLTTNSTTSSIFPAPT